jgi:VWFA-related protein
MRIPSALLLAAAPLFAQPQEPPRSQPEPVFRTGTTVLQVDAVVTDKKGRLVTGLTASDFEIVENKITHAVDYCSFVPLDQAPATPQAGDHRLLPEELRRTFVFVVSCPRITLDPQLDTTGEAASRLFAALVNGVRDSAATIEHFVNNRMAPGDLAEVLRVDEQTSVLAQPTNDRRALLAAADRLRSQPMPPGPGVDIRKLTRSIDFTDLEHQNIRAIHMVGDVVDQISSLPGRKVVVLLARFMLPNHPRLPEGQRVHAKMGEVAERANKAGVTVHSVAIAGLDRAGGVPDSADALHRVSSETGGTLTENDNDLNAAVDRITELNRGYYLLGYRVDDSASVRRERIKIRVKQQGLKVYARTSTLDRTLLAAPKPGGTRTQMAGAFASPLAVRDLAIAIEAAAPLEKSARTSLQYKLNIGLQGVSLREVARGDQGFVFEIVMGLAGPDGKWIKLESNVHHYRVAKGRETSFGDKITRSYTVDIDQPGYYQVRALVRDTATNRLGTAAHLIEVQQAPRKRRPGS